MRAHGFGLVAGGLLAIALGFHTTSCGPDDRNNGTDGCAGICSALGHQACNGDGTFAEPVVCSTAQMCDPVLGCVTCVPDTEYCGGPTGNDVVACTADGMPGEVIESCGDMMACSGGMCKTPCEAALDNPSNVGCDFWAVDLDNESSTGLGGINSDAAASQFAVVVANNNDYPISVLVRKNAARVGEPVVETAVVNAMVPPRTAQRVDLPQREVDGAMGQNGAYTPNAGSGTFVSPHAYHVITSGPAVVYQFNPVTQQYSNDASTLLPIQALGSDYIAVGFQTANPCGIDQFPTAGIPDHGSIAIIAPFPDTVVQVDASHAIVASAGDSGFPIPATPAGGAVTFTMGPYTVVNLETDQFQGSITGCTGAVNGGQDGDFTGTYIKSSKPVLVFTASERGLGFGGAENIDYPPDWDEAEDDICCTDHLEEQLLPVTALGREFAISRSPIRSTYGNWVEQDIIRVVGSADATTITTNLDPPYDTFMVNAREEKTFMARTGFALRADKPIQVSQYLVPQHFIKQGFIGDPSQVLFPAAEQHRKDYVFLVPETFRDNYAVFAKPVSATLTLDGQPLQGVELGTCTVAPIGMVANQAYEQVTCLLSEGHHVVEGSAPFGLTVYGYYAVGSYAFVGGSDVKIINPIL